VAEISRFFGIIIEMYFNDHSPPHFHARYAEHRAALIIDDSMIIEGSLPPRALGLVVEWSAQHRPELRADWERARAHESLLPIDPLR
jgi:hypothetical protein